MNWFLSGIFAANKAAENAGSSSGDNIPIIDMEGVQGTRIPISLRDEIYDRSKAGKIPFVVRIVQDGSVIYTAMPTSSYLLTKNHISFETIVFGMIYIAKIIEQTDGTATVSVSPVET